jgi:ABC-type cobalamin/Fe3+-siderophores transport system ATPase subunit
MVTIELEEVEARYRKRVVLADLSLPALSGSELVARAGVNAAANSTSFRRLPGRLAGRVEVRIRGGVRLRHMLQHSGAVAALTAREAVVLALLRSCAAEEAAGVIVALHDLNQVLRSCTTTVALAGGSIFAAGPAAEVLTPETIARLDDVRARRAPLPRPAGVDRRPSARHRWTGAQPCSIRADADASGRGRLPAVRPDREGRASLLSATERPWSGAAALLAPGWLARSREGARGGPDRR